mgnify:CR=1 FL=1
MKQLSQQEISGIKQLLNSPYWKTVENVAEQIINKIREEGIIKDNEWETLKTAVNQEGQVQGIRRLFQELWLQINENE